MNTITILLADDHTIVREGLRALLALEDGMEVVGEAINGHQAVTLAHRLAPDVVVMDLAMPLLDGLQAIARIRESSPASTKILVLSSYGDHEYVEQARALGASGYLVKQSDSHVLAAAIREIHQGHLYFKPFNQPLCNAP